MIRIYYPVLFQHFSLQSRFLCYAPLSPLEFVFSSKQSRKSSIILNIFGYNGSRNGARAACDPPPSRAIVRNRDTREVVISKPFVGLRKQDYTPRRALPLKVHL